MKTEPRNLTDNKPEEAINGVDRMTIRLNGRCKRLLKALNTKTTHPLETAVNPRAVLESARR